MTVAPLASLPYTEDGMYNRPLISIPFVATQRTSFTCTVQPLVWTGGALLAMLEARAHIATPYVFDFYFYHHVSNPYIQSLRADFMTRLQESRPRFVIEVVSIDKPWVAGPDTSREFPELRNFMRENYVITLFKEDYVIYELK